MSLEPRDHQLISLGHYSMFTCDSHNVNTRIIIRVLRIILVVLPEHPSDTYVFTVKMEILLEPTSNKLMVQVKMEMETPRSSGVYFITTCSYSTDTSKELMKAQVYVSKLSCRYFEPLTILLFADEALEIPSSYRDEVGHHRVMGVLLWLLYAVNNKQLDVLVLRQQGSHERTRMVCLALWLIKLLIKHVFTKVDNLRPGTSGHNLIVKVVGAKLVLQKSKPNDRQMRIAECLVGDETGSILFTVRNNQVLPLSVALVRIIYTACGIREMKFLLLALSDVGYQMHLDLG
ncbi:nucleic acid-binding, OB-fold-like protein [Tanacetum coccineum]|uniref:Nucleic acid-binding, OB-fold-like protein n=1 Tax=Tanacetum coccineum TaxID=301880 RepID=A0ABQ4XNQ0_9ASTR